MGKKKIALWLAAVAVLSLGVFAWRIFSPSEHGAGPSVKKEESAQKKARSALFNSDGFSSVVNFTAEMRGVPVSFKASLDFSRTGDTNIKVIEPEFMNAFSLKITDESLSLFLGETKVDLKLSEEENIIAAYKMTKAAYTALSENEAAVSFLLDEQEEILSWTFDENLGDTPYHFTAEFDTKEIRPTKITAVSDDQKIKYTLEFEEFKFVQGKKE
jgi:hypothetical protein